MNHSNRFENFTVRARDVLTKAQAEAKELHHNYIGTEHLLLGLQDADSLAVKVLQDSGVDMVRLRERVLAFIGHGDRQVIGEIGLTARGKGAINWAVDEARRLGHHYIGTEHLLLGLLREGEGIAARILGELGVTLDPTRERIITALVAQGAVARRDNLISCRVDDQLLDLVDALVDAGLRTSRSDAATWLMQAGAEAHQELLASARETAADVRKLRDDFAGAPDAGQAGEGAA